MPFQFEIKKNKDIEVIHLMDTALGVTIEILSKGALLNKWYWNQLSYLWINTCSNQAFKK